ncbi:unnamed protein product [Anisakis simplex]|uniref:BPTI/Kunitz inhibitor domain-containing protein n=1 Tax=Anisakis simplex TaxID=6269 RepID=A0A0M3JGX1_ANISI|nr:unnamed protein product [Anisakis simplex]
MDFCLQPRDPGPCNKTEKRFGYNPESDTCVEYEYGGSSVSTYDPISYNLNKLKRIVKKFESLTSSKKYTDKCTIVLIDS